ncbi:hypothetical protein LCGC14_2612240, partial [marine sediment metagenome]
GDVGGGALAGGVVFGALGVWTWLAAVATLLYKRTVIPHKLPPREIEEEYVWWLVAALYAYILAAGSIGVARWLFAVFMALSLPFFAYALVGGWRTMRRHAQKQRHVAHLAVALLTGVLALSAGVALVVLVVVAPA